MSVRCFFGIHKWSDWSKKGNQFGSHAIRQCLLCGKTEKKVVK